MEFRSNKELTVPNIGLRTAVDYLMNKKSQGEIKDDAIMNTKNNNKQYEVMAKEFWVYKDIKTQAENDVPQ